MGKEICVASPAATDAAVSAAAATATLAVGDVVHQIINHHLQREGAY